MEISKMNKKNNTLLEKLKEKGWKDGEIKYSPFRALIKGEYGIIYNEKTDRVIVKYYRGRNGNN